MSLYICGTSTYCVQMVQKIKKVTPQRNNPGKAGLERVNDRLGIQGNIQSAGIHVSSSLQYRTCTRTHTV